jgi:hypothetical protein
MEKPWKAQKSKLEKASKAMLVSHVHLHSSQLLKETIKKKKHTSIIKFIKPQ